MWQNHDLIYRGHYYFIILPIPTIPYFCSPKSIKNTINKIGHSIPVIQGKHHLLWLIDLRTWSSLPRRRWRIKCTTLRRLILLGRWFPRLFSWEFWRASTLEKSGILDDWFGGFFGKHQSCWDTRVTPPWNASLSSENKGSGKGWHRVLFLFFSTPLQFFSKIRNKYTPEDLIMSNMAILRRDQPLSNHFQTHLRSIYPNLSRWNPIFYTLWHSNPNWMHFEDLWASWDVPQGEMTQFALQNDPFFEKKNLVLLLHLSMSANRDSTAAVMAFFQA